MADEDLTVTIEDEPVLPLEDGKTGKEAAVKQPSEDDAVKDLKSQLEDQTRRREAAERIAADARRAATQAEQQITAAKTEVAENQFSTVTSGLDAAQAEADAASQEHQAALEAGDFAKATAAQRKIAKAEAKIVRLEEAKADLEARKTAVPEKTIEVAPAAPVDPVEAYISGRTEPTANWLRSHKEFITDTRKNAKLTAAHWSAVGEGLQPDSADYFSHVETMLGLKEKPVEKVEPKVEGKTQRKTPTVAPVNASGGGMNGGTNEVRLTKAEAQAATDGTHTYNYDDPSPQKKFKKGDPIGIQEFARRKKIMTEQGLYDRSYSDQ